MTDLKTFNYMIVGTAGIILGMGLTKASDDYKANNADILLDHPPAFVTNTPEKPPRVYTQKEGLDVILFIDGEQKFEGRTFPIDGKYIVNISSLGERVYMDLESL